MTLREEVIKNSGEELLSEEVLEEMADWVVPLVQSGAKVLQVGARALEPVANLIHNAPGVAATAGAAFLSLGTIASILIQRRANAKRAVQTLKGVSEGDKAQLVKVADSDMSDTAKKSWIFKILGKYATKANQIKDSIKQKVQAEKEYRQEKKNIKDFKAEQKQKKFDEKNEKRYIKRNFGSEEKYKEYQDWKANKGL